MVALLWLVVGQKSGKVDTWRCGCYREREEGERKSVYTGEKTLMKLFEASGSAKYTERERLIRKINYFAGLLINFTISVYNSPSFSRSLSGVGRKGKKK